MKEKSFCLLLLLLILTFINLSFSKKNKKEKDIEYLDHPQYKEAPSTFDLKRCRQFEEDCFETEFFSYHKHLEPESSIIAKKAKFNRWLRKFGFGDFILNNFTDVDTNTTNLKLFKKKEDDGTRFELVLNNTQYFHDQCKDFLYFKEVYFHTNNFQIPYPNFKSKINNLIMNILYHTAYSLDSKYEEWIYLLELDKPSLITTLTTEEVELLKNEREAYNFVKSKRKEFWDEYYDFVITVHNVWMKYHPQMVKDMFRRPNVTMSDYMWARDIAEKRKLEIEFEGKKKFLMFPFLEFSGPGNLIKTENKIHKLQSEGKKLVWEDSEGLHLSFEEDKDRGNRGIFFEGLFRMPQKNYYYLLIHNKVPSYNANECIATTLVPINITRTLSRAIFAFLIKLRFPGTAMCLNEMTPEIKKMIKFLGVFVNLKNEEMEKIANEFQEKIDGVNEDLFLDIAFSLLPKSNLLNIDIREQAYESIGAFVSKYEKNLELVREFRKTHTNNSKVDLIEEYFTFYTKLGNKIKQEMKETLEEYEFVKQEPQENKQEL